MYFTVRYVTVNFWPYNMCKHPHIFFHTRRACCIDTGYCWYVGAVVSLQYVAAATPSLSIHTYVHNKSNTYECVIRGYEGHNLNNTNRKPRNVIK